MQFSKWFKISFACCMCRHWSHQFGGCSGSWLLLFSSLFVLLRIIYSLAGFGKCFNIQQEPEWKFVTWSTSPPASVQHLAGWQWVWALGGVQPTNPASLGKEQDFPSTLQWKCHRSPCSRVPRGVEGFGEDKNQNSTSSKLGAFAEPCPFPLVLEMLPDPSSTTSPSSFRCFSPALPLSQLTSW